MPPTTATHAQCWSSRVRHVVLADGTLQLAVAASAEDALREVLRLGDALAVVLLDVMMPGTDGFGTARLIRQRARSAHVPVIFITALDADRRRVNLGYQSGAGDYLTKSLEPEVIRGKVRAFVDLHRLRGHSVLLERRRFADAAAEAERVAQARLDGARGDELRTVETIQRIGTVLAAELDLGRLVQAVTEEATALTNAQFGAFFYNTGSAVSPFRLDMSAAPWVRGGFLGRWMRHRTALGVWTSRTPDHGTVDPLQKTDVVDPGCTPADRVQCCPASRDS